MRDVEVVIFFDNNVTLERASIRCRADYTCIQLEPLLRANTSEYETWSKFCRHVDALNADVASHRELVKGCWLEFVDEHGLSKARTTARKANAAAIQQVAEAPVPLTDATASRDDGAMLLEPAAPPPPPPADDP